MVLVVCLKLNSADKDGQRRLIRELKGKEIHGLCIGSSFPN